MKARDIMTKNVVSITPDSSIMEMAETMQKFRVSGLPVINASGQLVGLVTEGDCLRRAETGTETKRSGWRSFLAAPATLAGEYIHSHGRKVADVMTRDPITINEDTDIDEIVHLMEKHQIKRLPVVTDGAVVGIVSRANVVQALASFVRGMSAVRADDAIIRENVRTELRKLPWMAIEFITPTVKDGIVDLWGSFTAYQQDEAAVVAAENVPGVKEVRNHLAWVDPISGLVIYSPDDKEQSLPAEPVS
ncbi:CBS domain-containing protein [Hyphomicrobium sp. 99]|uniref:CBS domain-containing protein n=1 Tax=Hyphomicrobium sp. 99 TaxID=1163419 RepID=UPI0005F830E3|nr:CBS domain-containing protein [Hyphomicrobium sp. 99]